MKEQICLRSVVSIEVRAFTRGREPVIAMGHFGLPAQLGHVLGLVGSKGSGNPTSMRLLGDLDRPINGHGLVHGGWFGESPWR